MWSGGLQLGVGNEAGRSFITLVPWLMRAEEKREGACVLVRGGAFDFMSIKTVKPENWCFINSYPLSHKTVTVLEFMYGFPENAGVSLGVAAHSRPHVCQCVCVGGVCTMGGFQAGPLPVCCCGYLIISVSVTANPRHW